MDETELQERVENSPALRSLRNQLMSEVGFRMDKSIQFSVILIISIISVCIQIISYCRDKRNPKDVRQDIRDLRQLPARRLMMLRRRLKALWRKTCPDDAVFAARNPLLEAVYELSDSADDAAIDELMWLAERNRPDPK